MQCLWLSDFLYHSAVFRNGFFAPLTLMETPLYATFGKLRGFWGSMVFRHASSLRKDQMTTVYAPFEIFLSHRAIAKGRLLDPTPGMPQRWRHPLKRSCEGNNKRTWQRFLPTIIFILGVKQESCEYCFLQNRCDSTRKLKETLHHRAVCN